jgi:hypothetical protein
MMMAKIIRANTPAAMRMVVVESMVVSFLDIENYRQNAEEL